MATNDAITNVTFLKSAGVYRTGETAGFPNEIAQGLIERKQAVLHTAQPHPVYANDPVEQKRPQQRAAG
jgi:hypothetical protein